MGHCARRRLSRLWMWRRPLVGAPRQRPSRRRSTSSTTRRWSRPPRPWASSTRALPLGPGRRRPDDDCALDVGAPLRHPSRLVERFPFGRPPMPYPDRPIAFLAELPKRPPVKRAPLPPNQSPPAADQALAEAPAPSSATSSSSGPVVAEVAAAPSSTPVPAEEAQVQAPGPDDRQGPSEEHLRRQAFIRQEQMARSSKPDPEGGGGATLGR